MKAFKVGDSWLTLNKFQVGDEVITPYSKFETTSNKLGTVDKIREDGIILVRLRKTLTVEYYAEELRKATKLDKALK